MSTAATTFLALNARKHASFAVFIVASSLAFSAYGIGSVSLQNASSSHIILIPFVSFLRDLCGIVVRYATAIGRCRN